MPTGFCSKQQDNDSSSITCWYLPRLQSCVNAKQNEASNKRRTQNQTKPAARTNWVSQLENRNQLSGAEGRTQLRVGVRINRTKVR